jgi:hypothetical protein
MGERTATVAGPVGEPRAARMRGLLGKVLAGGPVAERLDAASRLVGELARASKQDLGRILAVRAGPARRLRAGNRCEDCQAPLAFIPSQASGKPMPLNTPDPPLKVTVLVHAQDDLILADQAAIDAGLAVGRVVTAYTSHYAAYPAVAACPAADRWRGRRRAAGGPPAWEG